MTVAQEFLEVADWLDAAYEALSVNDIDLFLTAFGRKPAGTSKAAVQVCRSLA